MRLNLSPATERFIRSKVSSGEYDTPSDVVEAGLATLKQHMEFPPGELERLISEGEASIKAQGTIDARTALRKRRQRRASKKK